MVVRLYGSPFSTCTLRVGAVLKEYNVPFQFIPVDLSKSEHKSESFLKIQPFGQVPYLEDDGFLVYESRAICRYVAAKYCDNIRLSLLPDSRTEAEKYAMFEQAASVETSHFDHYASAAAHEFIFKPMRGVSGDVALGRKLIESLGRSLDVYDKILSDQKYIAGDEVTLADIFHLPYGSLLMKRGHISLEDEKRPNVARWWKEITLRPSWQAVKDGVTSTA